MASQCSSAHKLPRTICADQHRAASQPAHRLDRPQVAQLLLPVRVVLWPEPLAGAPGLPQRLRNTPLAIVIPSHGTGTVIMACR